MDNERHDKESEKSRSDVEAGVKHAEQELSVVQKKHNRLGSVLRLSPIQHLPDEVLAEIWNHVRGPELNRRLKYCIIPFAYVASWVSSRWRNVAIGTAGLWRDIYLSPFQSVELIRIQLERSKTCSLNIRVAGDDSDRLVSFAGLRDLHHGKMDNLATVIVPSVDRWYSLECDGTAGSYLAKILLPLRNACAPQLKHLYLRCSRWSEFPYLDPVFTGGAPNLAYVGFHNMSVSSNLTLLRGLNHLDLCNISSYGLAGHADFQSLLAACPLLTSLSVSGRCFDSDDSTGSDSSTCMPSLASLRYCAVHSEDDFESDLFNAFSAPVLQSLELVNLGLEAYGTVVSIMNSNPPSARYPMLSKLSIFTVHHERGPPAFSEDALQFFTLFPHIKNLELICAGRDMPYIMEALMSNMGGEMIDDAELVCPRLTTLTCPPLSDDNKSLVQDFITARASLGHQVRKLDIDTILDASLATREWLSENMHINMNFI